MCESGCWSLHVNLNFCEKFEFPPTGGQDSRESDLVLCIRYIIVQSTYFEYLVYEWMPLHTYKCAISAQVGLVFFLLLAYRP